jgi:hypothetical protein
MIFQEVPGAVVGRSWKQISILYSNLFRVRALSKDNQFRLSIAVGFSDSNGIPVIVSQKTRYLQEAVWQETRVPVSRDYEGQALYIYARISDVQWGARGPVNFLLQEGDSMIYESASAKDIAAQDVIVGELPGSHAPAAVLPANTNVVIAANLKRRRGFIQNLLSNPVFVYFGPAAAAGGDKQTARLTKGARIDIPEKYVGPIHIDVKGQFTPDASLLSSIQYLAAEDI